MSQERVSLKQAIGGEQKGNVIVIRPSALEGKTGIVAKGIFEKIVPNKFDGSKNDYFLRDTATNDLYILNSTKALKDQLEQPGTIGLWLEVEYNGKKATKNKKGYHDFSVYAVK